MCLCYTSPPWVFSLDTEGTRGPNEILFQTQLWRSERRGFLALTLLETCREQHTAFMKNENNAHWGFLPKKEGEAQTWVHLRQPLRQPADRGGQHPQNQPEGHRLTCVSDAGFILKWPETEISTSTFHLQQTNFQRIMMLANHFGKITECNEIVTCAWFSSCF